MTEAAPTCQARRAENAAVAACWRALLFWGWQSGFLLAGAIMGVVLESARLVRARWDLTEEDFRRIWNFCALLALALAGLCFHHERGRAAAWAGCAILPPARDDALPRRFGHVVSALAADRVCCCSPRRRCSANAAPFRWRPFHGSSRRRRKGERRAGTGMWTSRFRISWSACFRRASTPTTMDAIVFLGAGRSDRVGVVAAAVAAFWHRRSGRSRWRRRSGWAFTASGASASCSGCWKVTTRSGWRVYCGTGPTPRKA